MNSYDEEIDDKVKAYYKLQNLLAYMISLENPSIVKPDI